MRRGDTRVFASKPVLIRMVNMRLAGYTVASLGVIFHVHHSSVSEQCRRYNIVPLGSPINVEHAAASVLYHILPRFEEVDGERISMGKTYAEYLKEQEYRQNFIRKE